MGNKDKTISFKKSVKIKNDQNEYVLQMKKRKFPWWIFLFLLPLLLLIQCYKDVTVVCVDAETGEPIPGVDVTLAHSKYSLVNGDWVFFSEHKIKRNNVTDKDGKVVFEDLPCTVFSYIFHCGAEMVVTAKEDCYEPAEQRENFHFTKNVEVKMEPLRKDLHVQLFDKEEGYVLPDGYIIYKYRDFKGEKVDSAKANANGIVTIPNFRCCADIDEMVAKCYGYVDTIRTNVAAEDLLVADESTAFRLRPVKERFTFFVKNKKSEAKEPIPDAECIVTLTNPTSGKKIVSPTIRTSVDGRGIAVYNDAFILAQIAITAKKQFFKPGKLEDGPNGPWTVDEFLNASPQERTIWLEPEPQTIEFQNVDNVNGEPIPGVTNKIEIKDPGGNVLPTKVELSNSNGRFPVTADFGSKITIISTLDNMYEEKTTDIVNYSQNTPKDIKMQPIFETFKFQIIDDETSEPIPAGNINATGTKSGTLKASPNPSGSDGCFTVKVRVGESLSISASKAGYKTNNYTVKNMVFSDLKSRGSPILIPLKPEEPTVPCNANVEAEKQTAHDTKTWNLGKKNVTVKIECDFYGYPDIITVYDGGSASGTPLPPTTMEISDEYTFSVTSKTGKITIVIDSPNSDSVWKYKVHCP